MSLQYNGTRSSQLSADYRPKDSSSLTGTKQHSNGKRPSQRSADYHPQDASSLTGNRQRRTRVQRTNTLSGVTDQARRVLDELLFRRPDEIKKEIPFSAPTPYDAPSSRANGHKQGYIIDALSPQSDDDTDRVDGGSHKRRPSHGLSTVLGDSSPSPVEPYIPKEIVNRKKKTFFVRAKERMRETLRRQEKKPPVTPIDERADPETASVGKKNPWRLSFKKHKKAKKAKENVGVESSKKSSWKPSDQSFISSTSKDSKERLSVGTSHPALSPSEPSPLRNSLPNSKAHGRDVRVPVPVRSRSTDETRLKALGPEEQAILRRYFSTAGKSRTSDSRPRNSTTATQEADTTATTTGLTVPKAKRTGHYSLRKNLHLEGLVPNYTHVQPVNGRQYQAPLAVPEDSQITPDDEGDSIDGNEPLPGSSAQAALLSLLATGSAPPSWSDRPLVHATSKPFVEKSNEEREELYGRIAEQLDVIGDSYCFGSAVDRRKAEEKEETVTDGGRSSASFEMRRTESTSSLSEMTARIGDLMRNTDYNTFQRVVNRTIGSEPGLEQIAAMFRMTKCAVHLVGIGTSTARSIKEMAIRYFEDHFAPWVVDEGGWESVVEESATDMEID